MKRWSDPSWKQEMRIKIDFNLMMSARLGESIGLDDEDLERLRPPLQEVHEWIEEERSQNRLPFLTLPFENSTAVRVKAYRKQIKPWAENFVVLGIGGSALGAKALFSALCHPYFNLLSRTMRKGYPRLFVADNIDPDGFQALLEILEIRRTVFNVVSKSGGTAETMSQFLFVRDLLKKKAGSAQRKRPPGHHHRSRPWGPQKDRRGGTPSQFRDPPPTGG